MRIYTGSTSCDDRATRGNNKGKIMVNLKENVRDAEEINRLNDQCVQYGKPPHYDLEKAQRNITYENCLTNEEAFMYVLGEAMENFNASQKRGDRKTSLEKELEKLEKGKVKQELIHCMVAQVGNEENHPSEEECVEILNDYLEQFRERFPNMRIVNAAIHLDEATPHLQIYFIPVKTREQHEAMRTGKKWSGMDVQPSLKGALEQMGYTNDATVLVQKKDENGEVILGDDGEPIMVEKHDYKNGAMAQWQRDFNGLLDEICLTHGIELDHYMRGQKVSHQDTLDYQEGRIQRDVNAAKDELETVKLFTKEERQTLQETQEDLEKTKEEKSTLEGQNEALRTDNEALEAEIKNKKGIIEKMNDALANLFTRFHRAYGHLQKILDHWLNEDQKIYTDICKRMEEPLEKGGKAMVALQEVNSKLFQGKQPDEKDREKVDKAHGDLKQATEELEGIEEDMER